MLGMAGKPGLGRRGNPAPLAFAHRFRSLVEPCAGLDLDEDQDAAAPCGTSPARPFT